MRSAAVAKRACAIPGLCVPLSTVLGCANTAQAIVVGKAATSPAHRAHTKSTQKHAALRGSKQTGSAAVAPPTDLPFTCALPLRALRANCAGNACDAAAAPTNGGAGTCGSSLVSGASCTPTCNGGYTASGSRSCSYGSYTNTFACNPNRCDASTALSNGLASPCTSSLASGGSCTPTCNGGYTASGTRVRPA
jgi:hypothetical protein